MRLFMVYAAGNFIECGQDAPFLQVGEHKYGKPILDRAVAFDSDLYDSLKIGLISMDSTMRSNLGVGLPIDIAVIRRDALEAEVIHRIEAGEPYFHDLRERWSAPFAPPTWRSRGRPTSASGVSTSSSAARFAISTSTTASPWSPIR
jgi:putative proteasome-type protease